MEEESKVELEEALARVGKDIEDNGLQSNKPKQENKKMATKKTAKSKAPAKAKAEKQVTGYTAKELAAEFDIAPAELRKGLRAIKATKPGKSWAWPKKTDSDLVSIRKDLKEHFKAAASKPAKEKKAPTKKSGKKTTTKKTKKKSSSK